MMQLDVMKSTEISTTEILLSSEGNSLFIYSREGGGSSYYVSSRGQGRLTSCNTLGSLPKSSLETCKTLDAHLSEKPVYHFLGL